MALCTIAGLRVYRVYEEYLCGMYFPLKDEPRPVTQAAVERCRQTFHCLLGFELHNFTFGPGQLARPSNLNNSYGGMNS
jgi:hypothetical protein